MASSRSSVRLTSRRRRQRSVRVTVSVSLLAVATVAVLASIPTQSPALLSASAVAGIALGWAALRICWTEVLQSRREHASDRAATAGAYQSLFTERAVEHAEFTTAMTERLAESNLSLRELEGALAQALTQAAEMTARAEASASFHAAALVRVAELERSIELMRSERAATELVAGEVEPGSVEDLMSFDEKIAEASGKHARPDAKLA